MKLIVASLALFAFIGTATAFSCYVCNSETDSACGDELKQDSPALKEAFLMECKKNETEPATDDKPFCRKVKEYIDPKDGVSVVRVHRECAWLRREGYECYQKRAEDYVMNVCQCDDTGCNSGPSLAPVVLMPLLVSVFPVFARLM